MICGWGGCASALPPRPIGAPGGRGGGGPPAADLRHGAQAAFLQHLLHALDGEPIAIEQRANAFQQVNIVGTVIAAAASALDRLDLGEAAFPEAQHMLRHVQFVRDLADRAEGFGGLGRTAFIGEGQRCR